MAAVTTAAAAAVTNEVEVEVENDESNDQMADFDSPLKPKRNKFVLLAAFLASTTSILLGCDIGVMSGAAIFIKEEFKISDFQIEVMVGILNVFSLVGSAVAGRISDWIGRRYTIVVTGVIFFAGALLMGLATNYAFLMVGRFVAGIGVGYALMIAPVYTAELSPDSSRGFLTSFPEVFMNVGILLSYVSNYAFSNLPENIGWRLMLGVGAVPSLFLAVGVLAMPESPRWLVMKGRLGDAKRVLDKTSDSPEEAETRLADIKTAAGIPEECNDDVVQVEKKQKQSLGGVWKELLLLRTTRHILLCAVGIHFFQQATGIDAVVLYSPRIFEKAGVTSSDKKLLATIAVGFAKTLFVLVAMFLVDRVGRWPLLLISAAGMATSLVTLGWSLEVIEHHHWAVAVCMSAVLAYVAFFSVGVGPVTWVYSSEIFPLPLRAQGTSVGIAVNRVVSAVISTTFISMYKGMTIGGAFLLFAGIAVVAFVFFLLCCPETRGRKLEEMDTLFGDFMVWRKKKERE